VTCSVRVERGAEPTECCVGGAQFEDAGVLVAAAASAVVP
jgi:hypothetical protein